MFAAVVVTLGLAGGVGADPQEVIERVVVLDLNAKDEVTDLAIELSELVVGSIRAHLPGTEVTGQSDIKAMLSVEQQKMTVGCEDDTSCLAEIGGALGADHVVTGRLGKVGEIYLLSLKLIHAPRALVVRQFSERIRGNEEQLVEAVSQGAVYLVDGTSPTKRGYLVVKEAAEVIVDGEAAGRGPGRIGIDAGQHTVVLRRAAGESAPMTVSIAPYTAVELGGATLSATNGAIPESSLQTEDGDSPWYTSWWVWTIAGVLVAGGVGAGVAVGLSGGNNTPETVGGGMTIEIPSPGESP